MEFTIECPIDGAIEVGLEDIDTVVLRDAEHADITFVCPECGTRITLAAIVPAFLMSAIEALADDDERASLGGLVVVPSADRAHADSDDDHIEAYCEYFRRQLSHVECVEDALAEMGQSPAL